MSGDLGRREFIGLAASALAAGAFGTAGEAPEALRVRFLGTGAADWTKPDKRGEYRRHTSILLNGKTLVDFTPSSRDKIPEGCRPETIFYTHSHDDHYNPAAAVALGIRRAYVHESWHSEAVAEFRKAADKAKLPAPEVRPLVLGATVEEEGLRFKPLPANHITGRPHEQTIFYLVENGAGTRLLYATDTSGIPAKALSLIGNKPVGALVMEATIGMGHEDDWRIFGHSSVAVVAQTARVLARTRQYAPPPGRPVWITHLARTLHGTQKELDERLPKPLCAARDGMEIVL